MSLPRIPGDADVVYARPEAADAYLWTQFDDNALNGALCIERGNRVHVFENVCESSLLLAPVAPTDTVYLYTLETKDTATPDDIVFRLKNGAVVTRYALDGETITMFQEMHDHDGSTVYEYDASDADEAVLIRANVRWLSRFGYAVHTLTHQNSQTNDTVTLVTEDDGVLHHYVTDTSLRQELNDTPIMRYTKMRNWELTVDATPPAWYDQANNRVVH